MNCGLGGVPSKGRENLVLVCPDTWSTPVPLVSKLMRDEERGGHEGTEVL